MPPFDPSRWHHATQLVHAGQERLAYGETSEALHLTSGYTYENAEAAQARFLDEEPGYLYSRYGSPTVSMLEERAATYEGYPRCIGFASGMAAVTAALMASVRCGDHIIAARALFGNCRYVVDTFLPRYGIETTLVDGTDLDAWKAAARPNTRALFFESPTNPSLELIDIALLVAFGREIGARVILDNAFASPVVQRPAHFGVDVVVYSATKHIDGQGRCLAGLLLADDAFIDEQVFPYVRNTGPALSPFNAWVMLKGYETLPLRVEAMSRSAAHIADVIADHPRISWLRYPGRADHPQYALAQRQMSSGGTMIAFEVQGGQEAAFRVLNALELILISNNLGDAKSLCTHPATTTHSKMEESDRVRSGVTQGTLRLSVGLEDTRDLQVDLTQALDSA